MFDLSIHAADAADLYKQIRDLAGPAMLEGYPDEALLTEVRQRFAKKGFVVVLKPFEGDGNKAEETDGEPPNEPTKGKPGRKPAAVKTIEHDPKETPKPVEPASDTAKAMAETPATIAALTQEDVKAALNGYSAIHGQMGARTVMQTVGGAARLMDIPEAKFGAVIAALSVQVAA